MSAKLGLSPPERVDRRGSGDQSFRGCHSASIRQKGIAMSSVTLEKLQPFINKEAVFHVVQEDGSLKEVTGTIKAATVAGVPFKVKGKSGLELTTVDKIEEIDYAPVKPKPVAQKKLKPVDYGQTRQHLVDRHGVELEWAKNADEKQAFEYHKDLDHANLGHRHEAKDKDEREEALEEGKES